MENVLITGINGFVGSNLALDQLARENHVIGIVKDRNRKSRLDVLEKCSIVYGDICDLSLVDNVVSHYEVDTIFHLAANSIVKMGVKDPVSNYMTNVMGTVNILDSARRINPAARIVCASSDKAYGVHEKMPYTEDMKLNPGCPYGTSKSCADMVAQSFAKTYGLNVGVVRCSNIYGPGDMNTSRLVPNSILRILRGERPMIYSGVASYKRELIYIKDVCEAYNLVAKEGVSGGIYNIGINKFYTIEEVVRNISNLMGSDGIEVVEKDFPEIPDQWMDGSKLKSLGWKENVDLEEGLKRSIDWYKSKVFSEEKNYSWAAKEIR